MANLQDERRWYVNSAGIYYDRDFGTMTYSEAKEKWITVLKFKKEEIERRIREVEAETIEDTIKALQIPKPKPAKQIPGAKFKGDCIVPVESGRDRNH